MVVGKSFDFVDVDIKRKKYFNIGRYQGPVIVY